MCSCLTRSSIATSAQSKMKFRLNKGELKKSLLSLVIVAASLMVYFYIIEGQVAIADSLCLSGILFLSIALWRVVRILGLFDRTFYSWKKMAGKVKTDFYQYTQENPYTERFEELLILSVAFILISIIL